MSRFSSVWADLAKENNLLRVLVYSLGGLAALLGVTSMRLALRAPVLIERACASRVIAPASADHPDDEIEAFVKEAVAFRFNTEAATSSDLVSLGEIKARESEQAELKKRQMTQRVLVNRVTKNGDHYSIDVDRLLSVGQVRSVFIFPLDAKIESTSRTAANPYGLILTEVKPTPEQKDQKEAKK